jgi:hypothetical protein
MNALLTTSFLMGLALSQLPTSSYAQGAEPATPSVGVLAGGGIQASPLVRYLAATLRLSPARTNVVQAAVQKHQRRTRTPELLAHCLAVVLTTEEYDRFLTLQDGPTPAGSATLALR